MSNTQLQINAHIQAPIEKVWEAFNNPDAIQQWNAASADWHCPHSENNLETGGRFKHTMAAKDGSFSFDFAGTYTNVEPYQLIEYKLDDDRMVQVEFIQDGETTHINEIFEAEQQNPLEMQQMGWQAILNNFKNYVEQL